MQPRGEAPPALMQRCHQMVAPTFGTIPHWQDQGSFLMQGVEKGRAAGRVSPLAYHR
jgi:hypothetical protein